MNLKEQACEEMSHNIQEIKRLFKECQKISDEFNITFMIRLEDVGHIGVSKDGGWVESASCSMEEDASSDLIFYHLKKVARLLKAGVTPPQELGSRIDEPTREILNYSYGEDYWSKHLSLDKFPVRLLKEIENE